VSRLDAPTAGSRQLVRTIVELAGGLHATTVAEGIETGAELDELMAMGCSYGQGYYFARPVPAEQFMGLMSSSIASAGSSAALMLEPGSEI
jgi:EAL domain-containing protein (putative c-di-GMP-specific phosphodiesterase class I)